MAAIVIYDPADAQVPDRVTEYFPSAHTPAFDAEPNKLVNPDLSGVSGVPLRFWKRDGTDVVEMSQGEKDIIDAPVEEVRTYNAGTTGAPTVGATPAQVDRGALTDAVFKWDEDAQAWKYGLFGQERTIPDPFLFEVYEAGGGQTIGAGPSIIDLDSTRDSFDGLLLTGNQILCDGAAGAGRYLALGRCSAVANNRERHEIFFAKNGTEIPGTRSAIYERNNTTGGCAMIFCEVTLALNDTLDMRAVRAASNRTMTVLANTAAILLQRVGD